MMKRSKHMAICVALTALLSVAVATAASYLAATGNLIDTSVYFNSICIPLPEGVEGNRVMKERGGLPIQYCNYNYNYLMRTGSVVFFILLFLLFPIVAMIYMVVAGRRFDSEP